MNESTGTSVPPVADVPVDVPVDPDGLTDDHLESVSGGFNRLMSS